MAIDPKALLAQAHAAPTTDLTEEKAGGFERPVAPEGSSVARFISYVETGRHPESSKFGDKPPSLKAKLTFELTSKKLAQEIEVEVEGKKVKKTIYPIVSADIRIKQSHKSGTYKLLQKMAAGRDIKHFAQMLGESFIVTVKHKKVGDKTYANLYSESGWLVEAPVVRVPVGDPTDGEFEDRKVQAIATDTPMRLLLWDTPSLEQWDSIHTEGKNWMQKECVRATDFGSSALFELLLEAKREIPTVDAEAADEGGTGEPQSDPLAGVETDPAPAPAEKPKAAQQAAPKPAAPAADPLAAHGL